MTQRLFVNFLFMFISPAFSLLQGLTSQNITLKRWVLTLFITFYGSVIFISETNDGYRHRESVYKHYVGLSFTSFVSELKDILLFKTNEDVNEDAFIHVLSYFVAEVIRLPGLFFVFVSFIYGYFFSGAVLIVLSRLPPLRNHALLYYFVVVFILWKNIEGINTVRTWTGLWILFYGVLRYFETKRLKYMLLLLVPPLIHIAFFIMTIPTWLVCLFGVRKWVYAIIFSASFLTTLVSQRTVVEELEETEVGQEKVQGYYIGDAVPETTTKKKSTTWYRTLHKMGVENMAINVIAFSLLGLGFYFRYFNPFEAKLFSIGILTQALSNTTWFLFALSSRSSIIAGVFILATLIFFWKRGVQIRLTSTFELLRKGSWYLAALMLIPFLIFRLVDLSYYLSVFVLVFPFVPWIDDQWNVSVREVMGYILKPVS